jgi:cytochrome c oxidase subunit 1
VARNEGGTPEGIHMPSPSYYPALASLGIAITGGGLVYLPWGFIAIGIGTAVMLWGLFGWSLEPVTKEH